MPRKLIIQMHFKPLTQILLTLGLVLIAQLSLASAVAWTTVAPGVAYTRLSDYPNFPGGYLHAFRINLQQNQLKIALLQQPGQSFVDIPNLIAQENAVLATNGGFFSSELTPLGLLISQSQQLNPIKGTSWWGVFYIRKGRPQIVAQRDFTANPEIEFAIQSGPRLIINGNIPNFNPKIDYRTAIGITHSGEIILAATENLLLSSTELATIMRKKAQEGGLDCVDALNFDGGHSTQLFTRLPNFNLQVPSYTPVADAVLVVPKLTPTP